jgi:hypothetical protein
MSQARICIAELEGVIAQKASWKSVLLGLR